MSAQTRIKRRLVWPCRSAERHLPAASFSSPQVRRLFSGRPLDLLRFSLLTQGFAPHNSRFAIRTASVLGDCSFVTAVFGFLPRLGINGCDCFGVIEPCFTGCTFIGPTNGGFRWGITYNSLQASLFDGQQMVEGSSSSCPPLYLTSEYLYSGVALS